MNTHDMTTFLTTQEMQDLIHVDRSTVYRMAEDGRLPGVKVGRQWRFPRDQVARRLGLPTMTTETAPPVPTGQEVRLGQLLVPDAAQSVADLLGDLFGVMAVVTEMDGAPLTTVSNPCGFYASIADEPGAAQSCLAGWRQLADEPHMAPRFVPSHLGFLCARTYVWVELRPVGMIVVGGVTPPSGPPAESRIAEIADEIGVPTGLLSAAADQTWDVPVENQARILRLLPTVGDLISQLASARSQLLGRLDAIAALADPNDSRRGEQP